MGMVAAAAAVLLLWPVLSAGPHRETTAESAPPVARPVADIELAEGANGVLAHDGPDEVYALLRGAARFQVRPLLEGERFRVIAGGDSVEVRGTRFGVRVEHGKIAAVDVQEGAVLVTLAEGETHALAAGESWERPVAALPSASDVGSASPAVPEEPARARTELPTVPPAPAAPAAKASAPSRDGPSASHDSDPKSPTKSSVAASTTARAAYDARFQQAMQLLQTGQASEAARRFDELGRDPSGDQGRRDDALYWAAQAHARAGQAADAEQRARALASEHPGSWRADDAALLVGETLLSQGDVSGARPWLERAAKSQRESVRTRAELALQRAAASK